MLSQEQINIFHMHGYAAALILPDGICPSDGQAEVKQQARQKYLALTIRHSMEAPFRLIPNAYKTLMTYMKTNGIKRKREKGLIDCFEKEYISDGVD